MHEVLQALHADHVNLSRLLTLVQRELHKPEQGGDTDYATILDALDYIENYADKVHHVRENEIYARLEQKFPDRAELVDELRTEHRRLGESTLHATQLLSNALNDVVLDKQTVEASVTDFIGIQLQHIGREERDVFPLIDSLFEPADWQHVIAQAAQHAEDPLFGTQTRDRYRTLYASLSAAEE